MGMTAIWYGSPADLMHPIALDPDQRTLRRIAVCRGCGAEVSARSVEAAVAAMADHWQATGCPDRRVREFQVSA